MYVTGRACRDTLLTRSPAPRIERDWGAQGIVTRAGNLPIGSASPGRGRGRVSGQRGSCVLSALGMSPRRGCRVGAGRAWLNGVSLSCLWLPGAKQGAFSCVQLRDDRPSPAPLGCGWPDTSGLHLFLSQGRPGQPDHGLLGPLAIGPVSTFAAPSGAVITSCRLCLGLRPGMSLLSRVGPGGVLSACCFRGLVCPVTDAVRLPHPQGPDLLTGLSQWEPPSQRGGALCQARAAP